MTHAQDANEAFEDWASRQSALDPGYAVVEEARITHLKEKLQHLHDRAKYYIDFPKVSTQFLEMIEELQSCVSSIERSIQR